MDFLSIAAGKHTEADVAEFVLRHLIKQGRPAEDASGDCLYRAPGGLMCAAGCLIPRGAYNPSMEGDSSDEVIDQVLCMPLASKVPERMPDNFVNLIRDLQRVHDRHPVDGATYITAATIRDKARIGDNEHSKAIINAALDRIEATM